MKSEIKITPPNYIYFFYNLNSLLRDYTLIIFTLTIILIFAIPKGDFLISFLFIYIVFLLFVNVLTSIPYYLWHKKTSKTYNYQTNITEVINHEIGHIILSEYYYPGMFNRVKIYTSPKLSSLLETGWYTLGSTHFSRIKEINISWENHIKIYLGGELSTIYFSKFKDINSDKRDELIKSLVALIMAEFYNIDLPLDHDFICILNIFKENKIEYKLMDKLLTKYINEIFCIFDSNFLKLYIIKKAIIKKNNLTRHDLDDILISLNKVDIS